MPKAPALSVFIVDLDGGRDALFDYAERCGALSKKDEERAGRPRDANAGSRLRAAYAGLRFALEDTFGSEVRGRDLTRPKGAKPSLSGVAGDFSLAHSENLALIGVTTCGIIGVDLEFERKTSMPDARRLQIIAAGEVLDRRALYCVDAENNCNIQLSDIGRFQRAWVRLEAFAKAHGLGIGRVLTELGIIGSRERSDDTGEQMHEFARRMPTLDFYDLDIGVGVAGCIAVSVGAGEPRVLRLPTSVEALRAFTTSAVAPIA